MNIRVLSFLYLPVIFLLFLYSYTQVDLSLTISRLPAIVAFQDFFQNIGYFQRPLSTAFYTLVLILLFSFYFLFLNKAKEDRISKKQVWFLILLTAGILTFSYNAFSYDLFNYIFDAKIVTYYNQNPYEHRALDYGGDPMLTFMHWTHRTYPYGPTWLGLTIPLSFLGFNIFTLTFFFFKLLMSLSYLGTSYFISKILKKLNPKDEAFGLIFFALNPLIIVESLVSSHLDIAMMFFAIFAFYLLVSKKYIVSWFSFILSIGVKFATAFLLPVILWTMLKKKKLDWETIFYYSLILMLFSVVAASFRTNFQPWYLVSILPIAALVSRKSFVLIPSIILSFSSLLHYVPFIYTGNWDPPIPNVLLWITTGGILVSLICVILRKNKILI